MVDSHKKLALYPSNIAVIGGGRWSRVFIEVLCGLIPPTTILSVHTPHNAVAMSAWVLERGFGRQIQVLSDVPQFRVGKSNAVIVVNAARDHEKAIEWALSCGSSVLVEKPITLNFSDSQRLADLANNQNTYFASAHVFLFARYIENFSKFIAENQKIQSIRIKWMDSQFENRYGEAKGYDPGLTIFADWMPHVISILATLTNCEIIRNVKLQFLRGGAHLNLDLMLGNIPCAIELVRNGSCRQRFIEVTTERKKIALDFSHEPGTISSGSRVFSADQNWDIKEKPVSKMLQAFLQGAAGGFKDSRLDIAIGLRAGDIIEEISSLYYPARYSWLIEKISVSKHGDDSDLHYALCEIIHADDPHSRISMGLRVDHVYRYIKAYINSSLSTDQLIEYPVELISGILNQFKLSSYRKD